MASHVVVIDSSLKRATIKTTPATNLSNVLEEACKKLGHKPDQYIIKHHDRPIDLSRTIRLSGLTTGARLNLVQASRSPSVISVALQLPARGESPSIRLQDKFPSNTPVWQILRRFESGNAGTTTTSPNHNFTQQGTARIASGAESGSGRLFYAMPVINIMGRELGTFVDLQKTLSQLGFNGGTCLLRLSDRDTEQPLEEAMSEISKYFEEQEPVKLPSIAGTAATKEEGEMTQPSGVPTSTVASADGEITTHVSDEILSAAPRNNNSAYIDDTERDESVILTSGSVSAPTPHDAAPSNDFTVFAPPSSATPVAAAVVPFNEDDYLPTVAHAQQHQARLNNESRNRRLQSDKEIELDQQASIDKLRAVSAVTVRFRFPDNSSVNKTFGREATARNLYELCRQVMDRPAEEEFMIKCPGPKGPLQTLLENDERLIMDLLWQARVVVTVVWTDIAPRRVPCLKAQYLDHALELKVKMPEEPQTSQSDASNRKQGSESQQPKKSGGGGDVEKKLKGFLRLGKK